MANLLKFLAFLLLMMLSFFALLAIFGGKPSIGVPILAIVIAGIYLLKRYLRVILPTTIESVEKDERAPVIYLRSFRQEEKSASLKEKFRDVFRGDFIPGVSNPTGEEEQHNLAKYLNQIGPYTAIGRPGEALPFPGANKVYVADADWQDVVSKWIDRAAAVVMEPGGSGQGLSWEIDYVVGHVNPKKILVIFPRVHSDYDSVRDYLSSFLPKPLPEKLDRGIRLLTFKPDWEPFPISSLYPFFRQNGFSDLKDIDPYF